MCVDSNTLDPILTTSGIVEVWKWEETLSHFPSYLTTGQTYSQKGILWFQDTKGKMI